MIKLIQKLINYYNSYHNIFDTSDRLGSGPLLSKEKHKKFENTRKESEKNEGIAFDIRPDLYKDVRRERNRFLQENKKEKEKERQINLKKIMKNDEEFKKHIDEANEIRLIKRILNYPETHGRYP